MTAALLALLLAPLSHAEQILVQPVLPQVNPLIQPVALAVSVNMAAPVLKPVLAAPQIQILALPGVQPVLAQPVKVSQAVAVQVAPAAVRSAQAVKPVIREQIQALAESIAKDSGPGKGDSIARAFDSSGRSAVSVDFAGADPASFQGADRSVVEARRTFRGYLKSLSQRDPISPVRADTLIRRARDLGVPVRVHSSDLQTQGNHWRRGPHIHVGDTHIPVNPN